MERAGAAPGGPSEGGPPFLGVGLGFREELRDDLDELARRVQFLELVSDHYLGMPPHKAAEARELARRFPLVLHGLELSIGTGADLDMDYLARIAELARAVDAPWVSDHLAFTQVPGLQIGQLVPLAFEEETVAVVVGKLREVQRHFSCPFLVENISYYFEMPGGTMSEAQFITRVVEGADAPLLLDITNVYNNARNLGFDARRFLDELPLERVMQVHLAGGEELGELVLDTHSAPIPDEAFALLDHALPRMTALRGITIERDQNHPPAHELGRELDRIHASLAAHGAGRAAGGLAGVPGR
jgi:uncharacterized protein (UPF0276 family)